MVHEVNGGLICLEYSLIPALPTIPFWSLSVCLWMYCKWSKTAMWEELETRLPLIVIWLVCLGLCLVRTICLRSEVWASCTFLNEHFQTLLIRISKPNSRCSSLSGEAEIPYMEGLILFASGSCMLQLKGLHGVNIFLLTVTREHVLKMNVVLIEEYTSHVFSQTITRHANLTLQTTWKFSEWKQVHVGMEP